MTELIERNKSRTAMVAATAYASFFITGAANVLINTTMTGLSAALSVPFTQLGAILSVYNLGRMATLFISGVLTDKLGSKKVLMTAMVLFMLFFAIVPVSKHLFLVMLAAFFAGAANGMGDASGMPLLLDCFQNSGPAVVSLAQLFFGVGALFTPLTVGFLLERNIAWTVAYRGLFVIAAVIFILQLSLRFPVRSHTVTTEKPVKTFRQQPALLREGIFLGALTFLCACGATVIMVWTVRYLSEYRFLSEVAAVQVFACYSLGCIISAFLVVQLSKKIHATVFMIINLFIALVSLALSLLSNDELFLKTAYTFIGIGCGTLYSLAVAVAGELFSEKKGTAVGAISTASAVGGVITPFATGVLIGSFSLDKVYPAAFVLLGLAAAAVLLFRRRYKFLTVGSVVSREET